MRRSEQQFVDRGKLRSSSVTSQSKTRQRRLAAALLRQHVVAALAEHMPQEHRPLPYIPRPSRESLPLD
jgi:hypothetical protein